jgi:hypothetical protein
VHDLVISTRWAFHASRSGSNDTHDSYQWAYRTLDEKAAKRADEKQGMSLLMPKNLWTVVLLFSILCKRKE